MALRANEQSPLHPGPAGKTSASKASKRAKGGRASPKRLRAKRAKVSGDFARFARLLAAPCPAAGNTFARLLAAEVGHGVGPASPFARKAKPIERQGDDLFVVADVGPWRGDHERHMRRRWGRCSTARHRIEKAHRVGHGDCKRHDQANQSGCRGLCFPWNANRFWFGPIFMESTA